MGSDGKPPALPETEDPYVLLGVDEEADDKTIKQAYARLIRQYRPDRAPSEFQRIHAAFELIKDLRGGAEHVRLPEPMRAVSEEAQEHQASSSDAPHAAPDPDAEKARAVADRLREAMAAAPQDAAHIIDSLLDEKGSLELVVWNEENVTLLARHRTLSWTRLMRATGERHAVIALWELAWEQAFAADPQRAFQLLDDDQLRLDAADHPMLAEVCLSRIGALAWVRPKALQGLLNVYRDGLPRNARIDWVLESVNLEVDAAVSLSACKDRSLAELVPLLIASRLGSSERCKQAAEALQTWMRTDVDETLSQLESFQKTTDLGPLFEFLYDYFPAQRYRIDALPKDDFDRLTRMLHNIGAQPKKWWILAGVAAVAVGIGALIGPILPVVALGTAGASFLATETGRYRKHVRPRLAKASLKCGVTSDVMARWVQLNFRLAGRLWRYEPAVRSDAVLMLFSVFAATATTLGGLDAD